MTSRTPGDWAKLAQYAAIGVIVLSSLGILYSLLSAQNSSVITEVPAAVPVTIPVPVATATTTTITSTSKVTQVKRDPLAVSLAFASTTVQIGSASIRASIVDTPAERDQGLGGVTGLLPDEGMLFVFQTDYKYAFWMKDMLFSIDMVWISSDKHVVYIASNVSPDTYPKPFVPTSPARYVIELPAGFAATHNLQIGQKVVF